MSELEVIEREEAFKKEFCQQSKIPYLMREDVRRRVLELKGLTRTGDFNRRFTDASLKMSRTSLDCDSKI